MTQSSRTAGKLGRRPHDPARPAAALGPHLTDSLPANPPAIDWLSSVKGWPMYGNDQWGDCVLAEIGHHIEVVTTYGQGATVTVADADILAAYSAVTGFDPNAGPPGNNPTDQGTNIADALAYWQQHGIAGHKILAYAKVDHTQPGEVDAAINLFGAVMVGVNLPHSAMQQFENGAPWDLVTPDGGIDGGHAILVGAYDQPGAERDAVTWGAKQRLTDQWWGKYVEECWAIIAPEWLNAAGQSPEGIDLYGLGVDFAAVTGQPNPFPVPQPDPSPQPGPGPAPSPVDAADRALAPLLRRFVNEHHVSHELRTLAGVARAWLIDKELDHE